MPAQRQLPTIDVLLKHRERGMSYDEIAELYGVTKGAVYLQLRDAGRTKQRPDNSHLMPAGGVATQHQHAHPAMMLRVQGRLDRGEKDIPPVKIRQLHKWLRELEEKNLILDYHQDCPPNPGSPKTGGWFYSQRKPSDGDRLMRYQTQKEADEAS
jgi:hypothetical protein